MGDTMLRKTTLFITPVPKHLRASTKRVNYFAWHYGMAYKVIQGSELDLGKILSIRTVDDYRSKYDRICILYDNGTMEV